LASTRTALVVIIATMLVVAGCRTAPVRNVTDARLNAAPGATLTMDQVARAIWRGGQEQGWQISEVRPGELTGTLKVRSHVAVVTITHDTSRFSIRYRDSTNLLQSEGEIHKRYNTWVRNLEAAIQRELAAASAR
jgi:hypothetical protein